MKILLAGILFAAICGITRAETQFYAGKTIGSNSHRFSVSGVLRKPTDGVVIKLTQSIETARSAEEAVGQYTRRVQQDYPGYAIWDTIVTPIPNKVCETEI